MSNDLNSQFMKELSKTKDPTIFIGVARVLGIKLVSDEKDEKGHFLPRAGEDILVDVVNTYAGAGRKRKRELLHILKKANKSTLGTKPLNGSSEEVSDATGAEDSKAENSVSD